MHLSKISKGFSLYLPGANFYSESCKSADQGDNHHPHRGQGRLCSCNSRAGSACSQGPTGTITTVGAKRTPQKSGREINHVGQSKEDLLE